MDLGVRGVLATGPLSLRNLIPKEDEVGGSIDRSFWARGVDIVCVEQAAAQRAGRGSPR